MNIKDTFAASMGATESYKDFLVASPYDGYYGAIHFKFAAAATGTMSLQVIRSGVNFTVASHTTSAKTDLTWSGSVFCQNKDILRVQNLGCGAVNMSFNITHDSVGDGTWDEFVEDEVDETSSSSSEGYSSSSSSSERYSSSSSSEGYSSSSSSSELYSESSSSGV